MTTPTRPAWIKSLTRLRACDEAVEWAEQYKSFTAAWTACERPDWLLWIAANTVDQKLVVLAACACARTALKYVPKGERRPLVAIETTEAWARGEATIAEVRTAYAVSAYAASASAAASAASAYAASASASASAAYAAYAAYAASAYAASASASAASAYAASASASAARKKANSKMANLVRKHITVRRVLAGMKGAK